MIAALLLAASIAPLVHDGDLSPAQRVSASRESATPQSTGQVEAPDPYTKGDWLGTGALVGAAVGFGVWPDPKHCRWCDRDATGADSLNAFDRSTRSAWIWSSGNQGKANVISSITEFAPLVFLIPQGNRHFDDTAIPVLRAFAVSTLITDVLKVSVARERPDVHLGTIDADQIGKGANKSFVSGHTSGAFSMVFALARVYADRHDPHTRWVWIAGLPLAAYTGYLRIAADKHYATDVLAGAALGGAVGWTVPGLMKHERSHAGALQPDLAAGAGTLALRWSW